MPTPIPARGSVVDWLRKEAREPFMEARGDVGDLIALAWLLPMIDHDRRISAAIVDLLGEGDALVTPRLLELAATPDASAKLRAAVARAIAKHHETLASVPISSEKTALGCAIDAMWPAPPLSDDTLDVLHDVQRPEDGWPLSLRTGIVADLPRFADRFVGDFDRMSDGEQREVMRGVLTRATENTILALFERLAREASAPIVARVAHATKSTLDELDEARTFAAKAGTTLPGEDGATRWPRYAARLGVELTLPEPTSYQVIERFKRQLDAFAAVKRCTLTFPNKSSQPDILWEVYAAASPGGAPRSKRSYDFHPGDVVELTDRDDGLLTTSVQIGNYGPPEVRKSYSLLVAGKVRIDTCDDSNFDLVTYENTFDVSACSVAIFERVIEGLTDWHAARDAALIRREDSA